MADRRQFCENNMTNFVYAIIWNAPNNLIFDVAIDLTAIWHTNWPPAAIFGGKYKINCEKYKKAEK